MRRPAARLFTALLVALGATRLPAQDLSGADRARAAALFHSGQDALRLEDFSGAERSFSAATEVDPRFTDAQCALGQTYMQMRRYQDAVRALVVCMRLALEDGRRREAGVASGDQETLEQIQALRDLIGRLTVLHDATRELTITQLQAQLDALEQQRHVKQASAHIAPEILFALGTAYLRTGSFLDAEREYLEALAVRPGYGDACNNLAVVYMALGEWEKAKEQVARAEKIGFPVSPQMKADLQARRLSGPVAFPSAPNPATAAAAETVGLSIKHEPLVCLSSSRYPRIEARISPAEGVQRAWARFRSDPGTGWYAVQLTREGGVHVGLLPVPKGLKTFTYFLEASDQSATTTRTSEYSPLVVGDAKACPGGTESSSVADAQGLVVDRPPGSSRKAEPVPPGFGTRGTVGAIGAFDWSARTTSRIAGAIVIAGGATAVALSRGHSEAKPGGPAAPTKYTMVFSTSTPPPGSQVSIAHGSLVMRIVVTSFVNSVAGGEPPAFIAVDFFGPGSGAPCVEVVSPAHSPDGGVEEFVVSGPLMASSSCSLPFTTSRVTGSLLTAGRSLLSGTSPFPFDVAYNFVP